MVFEQGVCYVVKLLVVEVCAGGQDALLVIHGGRAAAIPVVLELNQLETTNSFLSECARKTWQRRLG